MYVKVQVYVKTNIDSIVRDFRYSKSMWHEYCERVRGPKMPNNSSSHPIAGCSRIKSKNWQTGEGDIRAETSIDPLQERSTHPNRRETTNFAASKFTIPAASMCTPLIIQRLIRSKMNSNTTNWPPIERSSSKRLNCWRKSKINSVGTQRHIQNRWQRRQNKGMHQRHHLNFIGQLYATSGRCETSNNYIDSTSTSCPHKSSNSSVNWMIHKWN